MCGEFISRRHLERDSFDLFQPAYVFFQAFTLYPQVVYLAHQVADLRNALYQLLWIMFQDLGFYQLIHAADRLMYDGLAPGLGCQLGFDKGNRLLPTETAIELAQIFALGIAKTGDIVIFGFKMTLDFLHWNDFQVVIQGALHQVVQMQADTVNQQQYQFFRNCLAASAGTIYACSGRNQRGKFLTLLLAFAGFEHSCNIAMRPIGTGKQVVFGAGNIRPQGTFGFTAAGILRDLILPGVVVENILVGRSHHGLQGIEHG